MNDFFGMASRDELRKYDDSELLKALKTQQSLLEHLDFKTAKPDPQKSHEIRYWWAIVHEGLQRKIRQHEVSEALSHLLDEVTYRFFLISDRLADGKIPPDTKGIGVRGLRHSLLEAKDIAWAIAYLQACKRGEIKNEKPTSTVAEAYDVTKRAVQKWVTERAEYLELVDLNDINGNELERMMFEAAARYQKIGRGTGSHE